MKKHLLGISAIALLSTMSIAVAQDRGGKSPSPGGGAATSGQSTGERGMGGGAERGRGSEGFSSDRPSGSERMKGSEGSSTGTTKDRSAGQGGREQGTRARESEGGQDKMRGQSERKGEDRTQHGKAERGREDRTQQGEADRGRERTRHGEADRGKSGSATGAGGGESGTTSRSERGGGAVRLSSEQRTKVQSAFRSHKTASVHVNVDVRPGVTLPRDIRLVAVPQEVVVIVPEWRRYRYVVIDDRVVIVDPDTYKIVEVILIT